MIDSIQIRSLTFKLISSWSYQVSRNTNPNGVKFAYVSGALEDSFSKDDEFILMSQGIREHVCDLLEGGDKAFKLREQKYQLSV